MITIITSIYKGDKYIQSYLENIVKCDNYTNCEHLLFNISHSNSDETNILIDNYSKKYNNINLISIQNDPGIYKIWNMGIKLSKYQYLLTSNIDDMIAKDFLTITFNYLENNPNIHLVATAVLPSNNINNYNFKNDNPWFISKKVNKTNEILKIKNNYYEYYNPNTLKKKFKNKKKNILNKNIWCKYLYFDMYDMVHVNKNNKIESYNIPHCCPVWRKSLNDKYGYFDEENYGTYADYEFWLRCMNHGNIFAFIPKVLVSYYNNTTSYSIRNKNDLLLNKIFYKYFKIFNRY